ncbi:hypothetical protein [Pectobacterium versatile]|uniref:hypothetical protein n=1 Tax=Pectobacterium versatile TaxID=2488639 RepID=UPI001873BC65|nr:hypothetical protein [Pectobacterium versatile]MBN3196976.1 hypothetical protein [Pectobacterium versatile]
MISKECGLGAFLFCVMVQDVRRPGVGTLMKTLAYKRAEVSRTLWRIAQDVQLGRSMRTEFGRYESVTSCSDVSACKDNRFIVDDEPGRIFRHLEHLEAPAMQDGYKFGVAQKLLNLLLKYLWCLGNIPEPPYCPVDRIILEKTSFRGKVNWTIITRTSEYQRAICAIKPIAQSCDLSIAECECQFYARR